ncbi:hypothetical protein [Microvirga calopogonii]|uniref:hypothetical protein n=1 Tax=Microvirga calopogonii TaxID=2078013 RepID=UPI0013B40721|nr:hypothetical protein [Microvirga calopogonii]
MRNFLIVVAYILAVPACVFGTLFTAMWLSLDTHEFGRWDPRYLLLIYGTQVEELGLMDPIAGSVEYRGRAQDGTAPAYAYVTYKTKSMPQQVIDTYGTRCRTIQLAARRLPDEAQKLRLACECGGVELTIEAERSGDATNVAIGGWEFE